MERITNISGLAELSDYLLNNNCPTLDMVHVYDDNNRYVCTISDCTSAGFKYHQIEEYKERCNHVLYNDTKRLHIMPGVWFILANDTLYYVTK